MTMRALIGTTSLIVLAACSSGGGSGDGGGGGGGKPVATPAPLTEGEVRAAFFAFLDSTNTTYSAIDNAEQGKVSPYPWISKDQTDIEKALGNRLLSACSFDVTRSDDEYKVPLAMAGGGSGCAVDVNYSVKYGNSNPSKLFAWKYFENEADANDVSNFDVSSEQQVVFPEEGNDKLVHLEELGQGTFTSDKYGEIPLEWASRAILTSADGQSWSLQRLDVEWRFDIQKFPVQLNFAAEKQEQGYAAGAWYNEEPIEEEAEGNSIMALFGELMIL